MEMKKESIIPVTLEGFNYMLWSRETRAALGRHGLWDSHIMMAETSKRMAQVEELAHGQKDEDKWVQEDQLALEIIQSSLPISILEAYTHCESSKELWESLHTVYGYTSNLRRVFEVKRIINELNQEEMEVNQLFEKFRSLWAELDILRPSSEDPETLKERYEQDKVLSLLLALSPHYNHLIMKILKEDKLPNLEEVCTFVQRKLGAHNSYKEKGRLVHSVRDWRGQKGKHRKLRKAKRRQDQRGVNPRRSYLTPTDQQIVDMKQ